MKFEPGTKVKKTCKVDQEYIDEVEQLMTLSPKEYVDLLQVFVDGADEKNAILMKPRIHHIILQGVVGENMAGKIPVEFEVRTAIEIK